MLGAWNVFRLMLTEFRFNNLKTTNFLLKGIGTRLRVRIQDTPQLLDVAWSVLATTTARYSMSLFSQGLWPLFQ